MKHKSSFWVAGIALLVFATIVFAANPTFVSFIASQFGYNNTQVWIKSGATVTNFIDYGTLRLASNPGGAGYFAALDASGNITAAIPVGGGGGSNVGINFNPAQFTTSGTNPLSVFIPSSALLTNPTLYAFGTIGATIQGSSAFGTWLKKTNVLGVGEFDDVGISGTTSIHYAFAGFNTWISRVDYTHWLLQDQNGHAALIITNVTDAAVFGGDVYIPSLTANQYVATDADGKLISTNGGGGSSSNNFDPAQFNTNGSSQIHLYQLAYYAVTTAPSISSFSNNVNSAEIGQTISSTVLSWGLAGSLVTNQTLDNGIGDITVGTTTYTDTASYTASRTYNITTTDGYTTNTAATSITFYSKEYWGASSATASTISDAQIIALGGSAYATSRTTTQTITTTNNYLFFCFPASFGAATFIVNGFPDAGWTLSTRNFVNASGGTISYNIYQHTLGTIGNFTTEVQ